MQTIISGNKNLINSTKEEGYNSKKKFILSPFNYYQSMADGVLVYNTLTDSMVELSQEEYRILQGKKKGNVQLKKSFCDVGLIIPEGTDLKKMYLEEAAEARKKDTYYFSANITTTLKCNARCYYCYERGVRHSDFSKRNLPKVVKFLKKRVGPDNFLMLNWFGGEPLLNPAAIDYITTELKKAKINFSSYIITNGILIHQKMIDRKFKKWNVGDVQITLDGLAETYEKTKAYVDQKRNIYARILNKIKQVGEAGIRVHIRLNVSQQNAEEILQVVAMLKERYSDIDTITWYPAFLTGVNNKMSEEDRSNFVYRMLKITANPAKMNMSRRFYAQPKCRPCMRNDSRSYSIDVSGNIFSCEHQVGNKQYAIGTLDSFDDVKNEERADIVLREECQDCVFLPKCMGGCAVNLETDDEPCLIEKYLIQGDLKYMSES